MGTGLPVFIQSPSCKSAGRAHPFQEPRMLDYEEFVKLKPVQRIKPFLMSLVPCAALCVIVLAVAFIAVETERQMHFRAVCAEMGCGK
jgi:hypothetical protein